MDAGIAMDPNRHFASLFQVQDDEGRRRAKFLSRVFGIFSEEIIRIWAAHPACRYEDLGRPTVRMEGVQGFSTLDFMLRDRSSGECFVTELKCEIEYQNFRYLTLTEVAQIDHHDKPAFKALRALASGRPGLSVQVARQAVRCDGAMLIWGAASDSGKSAVKATLGFRDVLTVAEMAHDLRAWDAPEFRQLLTERETWLRELTTGLRTA